MVGMIGQTNRRVDSMEYKLKMQMSPSLKHPAHQIVASFADITHLPGFAEESQIEIDNQSPEGSDEEQDTGLVFTGYDEDENENDNNDNYNTKQRRSRKNKKNGFHQEIDEESTTDTYNSDSTDEEEEEEEEEEESESSPSPSPPPKKKTKRKKKKKIKQEKSFWDVLITCITPSVCEASVE